MKVRVEELGGCKRALSVEVPAESVSAKQDEVYRNLGRDLVLPGFRKGKVPRELIERRFKSEIKGEVLHDLIPEAYRKALQEANLVPVSEPKVEEVSYEDGQPLRFRAVFEVKPSIQLSQYTGVDVFKEKVTASEEEVERALRLLQDRAAEYVPMEGWPAMRDDLVVIDYEASVGGKPLKGGRGENVSLILGSRTFLPGFEEQLAGMQKGEEKGFSVDVPSDSPQRELAGKRILFKVRVKEIKKRRTPPLDDEFAKAVGECENLGELREKLRQDLLRRKEREQEERLKDKILEKIAEAHPFDLPESLVEAETDDLLAEVGEVLPPGGDREKEAEALRSRFREVARKRVKASLILEAIAQQEGLEVSEEELDQEIAALAASLNQEKRALKTLLAQRGRLEGVKAHLLQRKALDFLYQNARITEGLNLVTLA